MTPDNARLPASALLLLLCTLLDRASAAVVLPYRPETTPSAHVDLKLQQARPGSAPHPLASTTVPLRILNVVSWPLPTGTSTLRPNLRRASANTICGYIGGDPDLPATCSAGSHCVLDAEHNAVGCCPDGADSCTAGVYTGCADGESATDANPYVYTCSSGSYCYKNDFGAGYYQYGCGTASTLGRSVAATASGKAALSLSSERVTFTGTYTATTAERSLTSASSSFSSSSTSSFSSTLSSSLASSSIEASSSTLSSSEALPSSSSSPTISPSTIMSSMTAAAKSTSTHNSSDPSNLDNSGSGKDHAGIIVGATISGIAGLVALVALAIFCVWKRRKARRDDLDFDDGATGGAVFVAKKQTKRGPAGFRSASGNFQALHTSPEDFETALVPEMIMAMPKPPSAAPYQTPEADTWATPAVGGAVGTAVTASVAVLSPKMTAAARNVSGVSRISSNSHDGSSYGGPTAPALSRVVSSAVSDGGRIPPPQAAYQQLSPYEGVGAGDGLAQNPVAPDVEAEHVPLTQNYDDGARGFHQDVLSRIGEEDEEPAKSVRHVGAGATLRESYIQAAHAPGHDASDRGNDSETLPQSQSLSSGFSSATNSRHYGSERDSSGVLPPGDQPLNLRGGAGSSFSWSADGGDENEHDAIGPDPDNTGAYAAMLAASPPRNRQTSRSLMWS